MIDEILNNREVLFNRLDRNLGRLISFYFARRLSRTSNNFWINLSVELFNEVESIFEKVKLLIINGSFDEESVIEDIVRLESYNDGSLYSIIAMDSLAILKTIVNSYVDKIKLSDTLVIFIDSIDYYIQDVLHANGITPNEDQILEHKVMSKNEKWLERLIEHIESINEMKPSIFSELNENFLKDNFE